MKNESVGKIKFLMIDTGTGEVTYAVLSVNTGFLNMGSKFFAVPLGAFTADTPNKEFVLDVCKERLEDVPGFDKDNWPDGSQHEFIESVYRYYNVGQSRYAAYEGADVNEKFTSAANTQNRREP